MPTNQVGEILRMEMPSTTSSPPTRAKITEGSTRPPYLEQDEAVDQGQEQECSYAHHQVGTSEPGIVGAPVVATSRMIESRNDYSNHHLLSLR